MPLKENPPSKKEGGTFNQNTRIARGSKRLK